MREHHVLVEWNRSLFRHNHVGVASYRVKPVTEFLSIGDRGAERNELHIGRQVNDDFFPDCPAETVCQVVDLIHHHIPQALQKRTRCIEHVAEHLGGHDDHSGFWIDTGVPGEKSNFAKSVGGDQLLVLLVGQGLHGCCVKNFDAGLLEG